MERHVKWRKRKDRLVLYDHTGSAAVVLGAISIRPNDYSLRSTSRPAARPAVALLAALVCLRAGGNLVFVTGQTKPITVLRAGSSPGAPLTLVGRIIINYPGSWLHPNSALGLRPTPGQTNSYDLLFQLGSDSNFAVTTRTAT